MSLKTNSNIEFEMLLSERQIQEKVKEIAADISSDFQGKKPLIVGILRGCVMFFGDLLKYLTIECSIDFMAPSSYQGTTKSSGIVRILLDLRENIEGRDVIIVEDIVDTGLTAKFLLDNFKAKKPKSVTLCTLLDKADARVVEVPIKYSGFKIPNEFVVGYGLDYNELYRNLPYVAVVKEIK